MNKWSDGTFMEKSMRTVSVSTQNYIIKNNKKDRYNMEINKRELTPSNNINPFLINNNYIDDLNIQNKCLIPQNSNC